MPRQIITDQLEKLKAERAERDAKIKALEAKITEQARKNDTRRKIVIGGVVANHLEKFPDDGFSKKTREMLGSYVLPRDRHLFPTIKFKDGEEGQKNGAAE